MKRYFSILIALNSIAVFANDKQTKIQYPLLHEYHVSVRGNDSNDGSSSRPFKTIMAAADKAMPGDVITVQAGTYREQITPPRGGNSDRERITYQAAKGEKVIIKGSESVKGWRRQENETWMVKLPNTFFGKFNPYKEYIHGDWFWPTPKDRKYLRGAVYLNGNWLMEAAKKEEVFKAADEKKLLWCAAVDEDSTTIWAQFKNVNPNSELVEINVRPTVFYPDKPFVNFITVRGFTMEHAATNWAPPTAEQVGLIGTHWSRGWVIEDNTVQYSRCSGITLGKYGDDHDNKKTESAEGYVGTIKRALAFGWDKSTVGDHIVRNNIVAYCEQSGIVGSMGCAFSILQGNTIHDIHMRREFSGAEQAGIKFHGAVDVQIINNHIYRTEKGIWLDWMAQGTQVKSNLLYENDLDLFLEVNHGPTLIANNLLLSPFSVLSNTNGVAFAHNLFGGAFNAVGYDPRITPYLKPHSTFIAALRDNPGGDVQFINNLYVRKGNARQYDKALLPVIMAGNVYTKGTNQGEPVKYHKGGALNDSLSALSKAKEVKGELGKQDFDAAAKITREEGGVYLEINLDKKWLAEQQRKLVTTKLLHPAVIPNQAYENADGSALQINTDYFGKKRNVANPSPGPFEIKNSGVRKIKVW